MNRCTMSLNCFSGGCSSRAHEGRASVNEREEEVCLPMNFVRTWPEYSIIENDDVVVTIEHCWECWKHRDITHHNEEKYMEVSCRGLHSSYIYHCEVILTL